MTDVTQASLSEDDLQLFSNRSVCLSLGRLFLKACLATKPVYSRPFPSPLKNLGEELSP